uniref:Uncharacterized protein n=1 Tax=Peronospora matthiolae TaxID=2874970 RepID=A0AAV1TS86_9STRA
MVPKATQDARVEPVVRVAAVEWLLTLDQRMYYVITTWISCEMQVGAREGSASATVVTSRLAQRLKSNFSGPLV